MPVGPTLLRVLIPGRHWQRFETFSAQFCRAARALAEQDGEPGISRLFVSSRQFERWYAGKVKTVPHPDACRVLEHMFGYPVDQLLGSASQVTVKASGETLGQERSLTAFDTRADSAQSPITPAVVWSPSRAENEHNDSPWRITAGTEYLTLPDPERIIAMAARRALRFGAAADASNVGSESLEQLRGETGRLAVAYLQQPLSEIVSDIVAIQDHTFSLFEGRQRPRE